jgi:putative ABC transport system permease protein
MIEAGLFIRLAFNNLRRGGQRVIVALLCIIFGVMSLVAMTMLSKAIERTLLLQPAEILGGDLSIGRQDTEYVLPENVEQLKALQQAGQIQRYTLLAYRSFLMFHSPGSGEMHFINVGLGIAPDEYPLAGSLTIGQPGSVGLPTLLQQVGDVVVTRDVAQEYQLKVGDAIVLADLRVGVPVQGTIRGIAYDSPNHQGGKIYFTLATAQKLANAAQVVNTVIVTTTRSGSVVPTLESTGWGVDTAQNFANGNRQTTDFIMFCLRGAGILGLLVGGIGIANTMQVLLRRRQREIAIWKTLGYREGDLRTLFTLEAGLLGLTGSLLGAGLGVLISVQLQELFRRSSNLLYSWTFSPAPPLMGILVGTLTTVIFAMWAIVISSQAQPMALLRTQAVDLRRLPRWQSAAYIALLAIPFIALTGLVMGSFLAGVEVLVASVLGVACLGAFFGAILWALTRLFPLRSFPLARMGMQSLRRRGLALVFAMVALFVGVFSMSMGLLVTQTSQREMSALSVDIKGYNLIIQGLASQEAAIRQAVQAQNPAKVDVAYRISLKDLRAAGSAKPESTGLNLLGRSDPGEYTLSGAAWGSQPDGVYASDWGSLKVGDQAQATLWDGTTRVFPVVGSYTMSNSASQPIQESGLLLAMPAFTRLVPPDMVTFSVRVSPDQVNRAALTLGNALPEASVLNLVAYATRFIQVYQNLFVLAMAMAGLALLAGILLIANSVSLAMLDRSHEIGVLKTIGYSRRQVLATFALEYSLVGVIATGAGLTVVQILLALLSLANHLSAQLLLLTPSSVFLIVLCSIGLTLLTVLGVTWRPTGVSPLVILNERN